MEIFTCIKLYLMSFTERVHLYILAAFSPAALGCYALLVSSGPTTCSFDLFNPIFSAFQSTSQSPSDFCALYLTPFGFPFILFSPLGYTTSQQITEYLLVSSMLIISKFTLDICTPPLEVFVSFSCILGVINKSA